LSDGAGSGNLCVVGSGRHTLLFLILLLLLPAGPAAAQEEGAGIRVEAAAWAVADAATGEYLLGENADERLPMASTTKIMTALVVLESGVDPEEEVVVSERAASFAQPIYSNVGLRAGDRISVRDLLAALIVASGNDAAHALAEHVGDGSAERFVRMMNEKAARLGLENTRFANPEGLDEEGHYTSARDLATLSARAMRHPLFRELAGTAATVIATQDREIPLISTNELLAAYPPATGIKTGTTAEAGATFVGSAAAGGESYFAVVLDARQDRFAAARRLLEYAFARYEREPLVREGETYATVPVPYRRGEFVELAAAGSVEALTDVGDVVEYRVSAEDPLPGGAREGRRLGEIEVFVDGERVGSSPLVAVRGYEEASIWDKIRYAVGEIRE
jgi:D-alanyl-D-alanine carboxypeptidase (penicillin-binding protein 5/6)